MTTGWSAEWCVLCAVLDDTNNIVDFNDSEDIISMQHNRRPWLIDGGFYNDVYVVYFLVGDTKERGWDDCIVAQKRMESPLEMIRCVEQRMEAPPINCALNTQIE